MKLYAKIKDNEGSYERVVLCQFENADGEMCYIEEVERHGTQMFKILADEGYVRTEYYYPVPRFSIVEMQKYE
jgi:hypothetical protein